MQTLIEAVQEQFNAEVGEDGVSSKENNMLRMKYGLNAAILTPSETYLIHKSEEPYVATEYDFGT
jgi:hypothetical protein